METRRLGSGDFEVLFHQRLPLVQTYRVGTQGISGDPQPEGPVCRVYSPEHGKNLSAAAAGLATEGQPHDTEGGIEYRVSLHRGGKAVIQFLVACRLVGAEVSISLLDVEETDGYQLVHVDLERLASATTEGPRTRVVLGSHGGRRIDPARCAPGELVHRYNWVREAFSRAGIVYAPHASVVVVLESLNDSLLSSIKETPNLKLASIGARMAHRVEAKSPQLQFTVHRASRVRLVMIRTDRDDPMTGWVPAARWLHDLQHARLPDRYAGRFVYKVFVGKPGSPAEVPFLRVLEGIRHRYHLFDGAKQICYLVGFQHEGHDSGYPDVFGCNEAAGGLEKLTAVIDEARACNTIVSFHDNYDDAYLDSPAWDSTDIALDPGGELLKGGIWHDAQAYWISLPKYVRTKAPARLARTLAMYPVHDTYHLDVLTASVFRPDFDPRAPTDRNDDFVAREQLAGLFRQQGLDVTTEGCGLPFLGLFRYFWDLPRPGAPVYEGDEPVPFAAFVAHGTTGYGGSEADRYGIVEGLYFGAFHSKDFTRATTEATILDAYYLLQVPLNLLRDKAMVDYEERGAFRAITYEDGSRVEVDFGRLAHRVIVGGHTIVEDFVSFAPGPRTGTWILYASLLQEMGTRMRKLRWPCPAEWRGCAVLRATALTPTGDGESRVLPVHDDGTFALDVPLGVPFRIRPDREAAPSR
jgi:hypothetical protein